MKLKLIFIFSAFLITLYGFSQEIDPDDYDIGWQDDNSKFFTGGTLGLQFGTMTLINLSPMLGYNITKNLSAGIGGTYQYFRYKNVNYNNYTFTIHEYGGRAFARYIVIYNIFAYAEYEMINTQRFDQYGTFNNDRIYISSTFIGPGYRERIGQKSYIFVMLLWNFNITPDSPYSNPVLRTGIEIGLK
jgi:hypothetical protein